MRISDWSSDVCSSDLLFVGYVGVNGCRLGLWIAPAAEGLGADLTEHRERNLTSYTWRVENTGYAVLAADMDERRLSAIARRLEQATRKAAEIGRASCRERVCQYV